MWDNKFDAATLAASTAASGFPATNLQHEMHLKAWRSTVVTSTTLDADLTAAQDIKAFFAYYNNNQAGQSFKIQADNNSDYSSLAVDDTITITAAMVAAGIIGKFWTAAQSFQYWRELMVDAAPNTYIRQGRIFLGGYFQPTYNVGKGYPVIQDIDPSQILQASGGQKQANILTSYKHVIYSWNALPASDIVTLKTIFAAVGLHHPYFICEDETDIAGSTRYVRNVTPWVYVPVRGDDYYAVTIEVETER
jgi:hypothetical protein